MAIESRSGRWIGAAILTGFGTVWYALADLIAAPTVPVALVGAIPGVIIAVLLARGALRSRAREGSLGAGVAQAGPDERAAGRRFAQINTAQWVAIAVAIVVANVLHAPERIPGAIAIIVGLHFFPLATLFRAPLYNLTAAAMCAVGAMSFALHGDAAGELAAAGGCVILWATAARVLGFAR